MEYTRLDRMIDVMFTTTADIASAAETQLREEDEVAVSESDKSSLDAAVGSGWQFTPRVLLQTKRAKISDALVPCAVGVPKWTRQAAQ
jgi:hypothetical protein